MMTLQEMTFQDDSFNYIPNASAPTGTGEAREARELPAPGYYQVRILGAGPKVDKQTGKLRMVKDRPIFTIQKVEIIDPVEQQGVHYVWTDVLTAPIDRKDGTRVWPFIELLEAIDASAVVPNDWRENTLTLERLLTQNPVLTVRLGYEAKDRDYIDSQLASASTQEEKRMAWRNGELKLKDFKNADGTYRTTTIGPSGATVNAELRITGFVASNKTVDLGPYKPRA